MFVENKIPVGILGATGTVGQRFVQLLADHPWFEIVAVTGSSRTAGKPYGDGVLWTRQSPHPRDAQGVAGRRLRPTLPTAAETVWLPSDRTPPACHAHRRGPVRFGRWPPTPPPSLPVLSPQPLSPPWPDAPQPLAL